MRLSMIRPLVLCSMVLSIAARTEAATYAVGPGQPYATPSAVPWESLQPGDVVQIQWRSTPYTDKWVICRQGTAAAPIVVRGVVGPNGERPIIEGSGATWLGSERKEFKGTAHGGTIVASGPVQAIAIKIPPEPKDDTTFLD